MTEVEARGRALGAEVVGLDWSRPLTDGELDAIGKALLDHQVVYARRVTLTPDDHVRLGERLGEVEVHAFFPNLGAGYERVSLLDSEQGTVASMWHTDETFLERPPMGTLLHAQVIPPVGGDTCFASMTAAYDALSAPMRRYLDGLTAEHGLARIAEMKHRSGRSSKEELAEAIANDRRCTHPVVRTHPETGARSLYVNPTYTRWLDGVPADESEAVLRLLFAHATHERFVYRHRWEVGDLLLWDNRCTMHVALNDFDGHRRMHRVSVLGARPEGA
ncbi:MAG: TauD/TfdA family dioxygenase [Actinomycetia bacterium]|nr:TauD/TfdA family dioxygenase [Actinomycetes bacterium]